MNLKEALALVDKIVFEQTGKHLNDLQEAVLQGTIEHQAYKQIAQDFDCSESNARKAGAELWQILSEGLGESVTKSNLGSAMKRWHNSILNFGQDVIVSDSFNTCPEGRHPPDTPPNSPSPDRQTTNTAQPPTQDLSEMPELGAFYSRTTELDTLKTWILEQRRPLITLTGIGGIGKTRLAVKLVRDIKNQFEYVIWYSLETSPTLAELEDKLTEFFSQSQQQKLPSIKHFQNHRCLVVLDDIHHLFSSGDFAGKYQQQHQKYRSFFKQIENLSHQSSFLLIGWEPPRDFPQIKSKNPSNNNPIRTLQLAGLEPPAAMEILKDCGLAESDNSETLIRHYQGNPFWLKSAANLIQELGESLANELLENNSVLLPEDVKDTVRQQCDRLSKTEQQILSLLATKNQPISLAKLLETAQIPSSNLVNALQSLGRRSLIKKEKNLYSLPAVLKQEMNL
jgi:FixJ family two-component response regulator